MGLTPDAGRRNLSDAVPNRNRLGTAVSTGGDETPVRCICSTPSRFTAITPPTIPSLLRDVADIKEISSLPGHYSQLLRGTKPGQPAGRLRSANASRWGLMYACHGFLQAKFRTSRITRQDAR